MRNLTITVQAQVLRWVRVWATRNDSSVSRLVEELLKRNMLEEEGYAKARVDYLSGQPQTLKRSGHYPGREELHVRGHLR